MEFKKLLVLAALTSLATACGGGGGGGSTSSSATDPVYSGWYSVYGTRCGNLGPGCNYYASGSKIIDSEDPYFKTSYVLQNKVWNYNDSYGKPQTFSGWGWMSPSNVLYNSFGNALNNIRTSGRNVVGDMAAKEEKVRIMVAREHAAQYGLSMEASLQQTRLLGDYAIIGRDRSRTDADLNYISERLYGRDVLAIKVALNKFAEGDKSEFKKMSQELANKWGTTPEMVIKEQKDWFAPYIQGYDTSL